jgi:hypothetical protein
VLSTDKLLGSRYRVQTTLKLWRTSCLRLFSSLQFLERFILLPSAPLLPQDTLSIMDFQVGANPSTEPGQPHTAQSDNARSPSPEDTPDIMPLCKLSAEEAEHDYQKQLNLLAEQTAHHDAQRASEPSLNDSIQQIRLLESQVERQREALGDSDPETLEASHELSLEYQCNGQLEKAEELQHRIIDTRSRHLGESHPDTLRSLLYLTPILYAKGEEEAGDQLQLHVLVARERVLGKSHADTIESVEQLRAVYGWNATPLQWILQYWTLVEWTPEGVGVQWSGVSPRPLQYSSGLQG